MFRTTVLILLVVLLVSTSGCIGKFALTRSLYDWNLTVSNKFVDELLFLILSPIYVGALAIDAVVLNVLEFVTGDNPVGGGRAVSRTIEAPDGSRIVLTRLEDGSVDLRLYRGDDEIRHANLVQADGFVVARDAR